MAVLHPEMLLIPQINQAVISTPPVGVDDALQGDASPDYTLESRFRAIRDDFGVDAIMAFEQAENNGFAASAPSSHSFDAAGAEVTFVYFHFAFDWRLSFAKPGDSFTESGEIPVDGVAVEVKDLGRLAGVQIECEILTICLILASVIFERYEYLFLVGITREMLIKTSLHCFVVSLDFGVAAD